MPGTSSPTPRWLSPSMSLALAATSVMAFHMAYEFEAAGAVIVVYLACLFRLAWAPSARWAFYLGLAIGATIAAGQLWFLEGVFGWAAVGLWAILGLWIAFFLLLARIVVGRWPRCGVLWLPVIWMALEYTRSELYYLRFAWLTPGFALSHVTLLPLATAGVYGFSFLVLAVLAVAWTVLPGRRGVAAAIFVPVLVSAPVGSTPEPGPLIVGIQLEGPRENDVLAALDEALSVQPDLELVVLSEYCFDGPVPPSIRAWCERHRKYLIAGGKEPLDASGRYIDTARSSLRRRFQDKVRDWSGDWSLLHRGNCPSIVFWRSRRCMPPPFC